MASYNTVLSFRLNSLCSGSFDAVPDAVVQAQLDAAQGDIDSALWIHHTLPFASGSVPASVVEAERVIAAYRLFEVMGIDPGTKTEFLVTRYAEIMGDPSDPTTGWLGALAQGTRALVDPKNGDLPDTLNKPSFFVVGQPSRRWQQGRGGTVVR